MNLSGCRASDEAKYDSRIHEPAETEAAENELQKLEQNEPVSEDSAIQTVEEPPVQKDSENLKYQGKTLVFWTWDRNHMFDLAQVRAFEKATGAKVEFKLLPYGEFFSGLKAAIAAGEQVDVAYLTAECFPLWGMSNDLIPVSDYLEPYQEPFLKAVSDHYTWKGKVFGVNAFATPAVMFYNKGLFEEAGMDDPSEMMARGEWNWDGFISAARQLTVDLDGDGEMERWGAKLEQEMWLSSNGVDIIRLVDGKPSFALNCPAGYEAYNMDIYFPRLNISPDLPMGKAHYDFISGNIAMYFNWTDKISDLASALGDQLDFVPFPQGPSGTKPVVRLDGNAWVMPQSCKEPELAAEFILFMNSKEYVSQKNEKLQSLLGKERFEKLMAYLKENAVIDDVTGWGLKGMIEKMEEEIMHSGKEPFYVIGDYGKSIEKYLNSLMVSLNIE